MKDEFDKRLSDRIAEVFDNSEDTSADAGWALLREKYPEKKTRRGVIWMWIGSAAALLLLFLGIEIWGGSEHPKSNKLIVKSHEVFADTIISNGTKNNIAVLSPKNINQEKLKPATQPTEPHQAANNAAYISVSKQAPTISASHQPAPQQQAPAIVSEPADEANKQQNIAVNPPANTKLLTDTSSKKNIAQNDKRVSPVVRSPFTENDPVIKKDKAAGKADKTNLVSFGVYAATYINYASGSSSQINLGAGLATDIHLTRNLKLSTGVAVNQNNLDYGNHLPQHPGLYAAAAMPISLQASAYTNNLAASYSIPVLKSYSAQLTSLDVPLDLKYEFNPQKNSSFISLGVSSGTFINEAYNTQYGYTNSSVQTQNSNTSSFNGFYLAKTLDLSFGLGYPIGKNHLSIEPFAKYPLQGLGADQIKFGAGGLNLKFNFSNNKK